MAAVLAWSLLRLVFKGATKAALTCELRSLRGLCHVAQDDRSCFVCSAGCELYWFAGPPGPGRPSRSGRTEWESRWQRAAWKPGLSRAGARSEHRAYCHNRGFLTPERELLCYRRQTCPDHQAEQQLWAGFEAGGSRYCMAIGFGTAQDVADDRCHQA